MIRPFSHRSSKEEYLGTHRSAQRICFCDNMMQSNAYENLTWLSMQRNLPCLTLLGAKSDSDCTDASLAEKVMIQNRGAPVSDARYRQSWGLSAVFLAMRVFHKPTLLRADFGVGEVYGMPDGYGIRGVWFIRNATRQIHRKKFHRVFSMFPSAGHAMKRPAGKRI